MRYSKKSPKKTSRRIPIIILVTLIVVGSASIGGWYFFVREDAATSTIDTIEGPGETPAEDPNFEGGSERQPTESVPRDGGVVDTSGRGTSGEDQGRSISSKSGKITVYQPAANSVLKNGATLSGKAKVSTISYRLIDDKVGVIGTGTLKVVGGKFSGTFSFSSNGTEGRLDVFNQLSDGREVDVVEIPVRFK